MWHNANFLQATLETLLMVFASTGIAALLGIPLGVGLYVSASDQLKGPRWLNFLLNALVSTGRSIPFIILLVALIPFTRFLVGSAIGTKAAIVPLSIAALSFFARLVEGNLSELPRGLIEAAQAMGASHLQVICKILLPEALPGIVHSLTITMVSLVSYSAMAGTIGGGGLGDLAIRYGYQRFDLEVMLITIFILIVLVNSLQFIGNLLSQKLRP